MKFHSNPLVDQLLEREDIHDLRRQSAVGILPFLIVSLILGLAHAANLFFVAIRGEYSLLFLIIHAGLTFISYLYAKVVQSGGGDARLPYLMTIMGVASGPFGVFGTFVCAVLMLFYSRSATSFHEWFLSLFPDRDVPRVEQMYDDIILGRDEQGKDYTVMPFLDVMSVGSTEQKRTALGRMTADFRSTFAPAFRLALRDDRSTIRVQAATSIAKIENAFYDRLVKLQTLVEHFPKRPEVKKALALHYDDYAFTGLLDPYREAQNRERARAVYLEYLSQVPGDVEVRQNIGRLLVRAGKAQEAADWFKASLDDGYVTDSIKLWYFECLFNSAQYTKLRDAVFTLPVNRQLVESEKPQLAEAITLWAQTRRQTATQAA